MVPSHDVNVKLTLIEKGLLSIDNGEPVKNFRARVFDTIPFPGIDCYNPNLTKCSDYQKGGIKENVYLLGER